MFTKRRVILGAIALIIACISASVTYADLKPGTKAPDYTLPKLDGKSFTLSSTQGKVVVMDIWATWCPPCRGEIPHLTALNEKLNGKEAMIVGVALDDSKDQVTAFAKDQKINYTVVHDPRAIKVGRGYRVEGIPSTYVIDRKGIIRYVHSGFPRDRAEQKKEAAQIENEVNTLLAEKQPATRAAK